MAMLSLMSSLNVPQTPFLTEGHLGSPGASTRNDSGHKLMSLLLSEPSGTFRQHTPLPGSPSPKPHCWKGEASPAPRTFHYLGV